MPLALSTCLHLGGNVMLIQRLEALALDGEAYQQLLELLPLGVHCSTVLLSYSLLSTFSLIDSSTLVTALDTCSTPVKC